MKSAGAVGKFLVKDKPGIFSPEALAANNLAAKPAKECDGKGLSPGGGSVMLSSNERQTEFLLQFLLFGSGPPGLPGALPHVHLCHGTNAGGGDHQ
jgi:hypothetical protein